MTKLELLMNLGPCCIQRAVCKSIGDYFKERQALEAAYPVVFCEGISRAMKGDYMLPGFLTENGVYPEYGSTYQRALGAPGWVKEQFQAWIEARRALPFLIPWMPYSGLLNLDHSLKKALYRYESYRVDSLEDGNECIDGHTGGHHRDILDLLEHATNNIPPTELGECWVYMGRDQEIQFDEVISSLEVFHCDYVMDGV